MAKQEVKLTEHGRAVAQVLKEKRQENIKNNKEDEPWFACYFSPSFRENYNSESSVDRE